jgi:hypothetical protein
MDTAMLNERLGREVEAARGAILLVRPDEEICSSAFFHPQPSRVGASAYENMTPLDTISIYGAPFRSTSHTTGHSISSGIVMPASRKHGSPGLRSCISGRFASPFGAGQDGRAC